MHVGKEKKRQSLFAKDMENPAESAGSTGAYEQVTKATGSIDEPSCTSEC